MLGFSPFKKRPNKFNYIPRFYDPEKEAREERRAELRGERAEDADREYRPGQYIRTQRDARAARVARRSDKGRMQIWKMAAGAVIVLMFIYMLYPRLADAFLRAYKTNHPAVEAAVVQDTVVRRSSLDQSGISDVEWQDQPIVIVPNDYQE